ncbi:MAG TPA: TIGR00374 family protein, partial [Mycobacterium sp.]|nr:TIGR00374 family protein [Mycobacterium sp.]
MGALPRTRAIPPPACEGETPRGRYWWVRWVILGIVAIVLAVEV